MTLNLTSNIQPVNIQNKIEALSVDKILALLQTEFTPTQLKVLNSIVYFCTRYKTVYISQEVLAKRLGVARETVNRLLAKIVNLGLIFMLKRSIRQTCLYQLPLILFDFYVRNKLSKILQAFKTLPYFWLTQEAPSDQILRENVTQYINKNYFTTNRTIPIPIFKLITILANTIPHIVGEKTCNEVSTEKKGRPMSKKRIELLRQIKNDLMMDDSGMAVLDRFEYEVLLTASRDLTTAMNKGGVVNKQAYFVGICNRLTKGSGFGYKKTQGSATLHVGSGEDTQKGKVAEQVKPFAGHGGQNEDEIAASWRRPDIHQVYEKGMANLKNCPQHVKDQFKQMFQDNYLRYNAAPTTESTISSPDGKEMTLLERRNARLAEYKANGNAHNRYNPNK